MCHPKPPTQLCHGSAGTFLSWSSDSPALGSSSPHNLPKTSLPSRGAEPSVPAFPLSPWIHLSLCSLGSSCWSESSQHPPDSAKLRAAAGWDPAPAGLLPDHCSPRASAAAPADLLSGAAGCCPHGSDSRGSWSPSCPCSQNHFGVLLPPCQEAKQGPFPEGTAGSSEVPSMCWPPAVLWGEQVPHFLLLQEHLPVVPRSPRGKCQGRLCPTAPWETTQHSQQTPVLFSWGKVCSFQDFQIKKKVYFKGYNHSRSSASLSCPALLQPPAVGTVSHSQG